MLGHTGYSRVYNTMRARFYHPVLHRTIKDLRCDPCLRNKSSGAGFGHHPPRDASFLPWEEVAVDLIGPWKIHFGNAVIEFRALTIIDMTTNLVELVRIDTTHALHVATKFENTWLARYPWPTRVIHDNGGEFTGFKFRRMLRQCGIDPIPISVKNPQANAVCERMRQTVANVIRTFLYAHPPQNLHSAEQIVDEALAVAMHATRCAMSESLGTTPGAMAFNRDMFLNLPLIADLVAIRTKRQHLIDNSAIRLNAKWRSYDYEVRQRVLLQAEDPWKLGPRSEGPYDIEQVHVNGTITIRRRPHVLERVNIRRVIPYRM